MQSMQFSFSWKRHTKDNRGTTHGNAKGYDFSFRTTQEAEQLKNKFEKGRKTHISDIFHRINNLYLLGEDSINPLVSARVSNPQ